MDTLTDFLARQVEVVPLSEEVENLLAVRAAQGSQLCAEKLFLHTEHYIHAAMLRFPRTTNWEALLSVGQKALWEAILSYNPARHSSFKEFALAYVHYRM